MPVDRRERGQLRLVAADGLILLAQTDGDQKADRIGVIELQRLVTESKTGQELLQTDHDRVFARIERYVMPINATVGQEQGFVLLFDKVAEKAHITELILDPNDGVVVEAEQP